MAAVDDRLDHETDEPQPAAGHHLLDPCPQAQQRTEHILGTVSH